MRTKATRKRRGMTVAYSEDEPIVFHNYQKECARMLEMANDYYADNLKIGEIKHIIDFEFSTPFPEHHARLLDIFDHLGLETARLRTLFREWIIEEAASSIFTRFWARKQGWLKE